MAGAEDAPGISDRVVASNVTGIQGSIFYILSNLYIGNGTTSKYWQGKMIIPAKKIPAKKNTGENKKICDKGAVLCLYFLLLFFAGI